MNLLVRYLIGMAVGAIPGILIASAGHARIGLAVGIIGTLAGALIALPGFSPTRAARLLVAMFVARNLPAGREAVFDWVDKDQPPPIPEAADLSEALSRWLAARDVQNRRGWIVAIGLGVGLVGGAIVTWRDLQSIAAGNAGILLPMRGAKDSLTSQAVIMSLAMAIWMAATASVAFAPAYRRMVAFGTIFAGLLGYAVGFSGPNQGGAGPVEVAVFLGTIAAALAMFLAAALSLGEEAPQPSMIEGQGLSTMTDPEGDDLT